MSLTVTPCPLTDPDALRLIGESEADLAALYAAEHRHAVSPEQRIAAGVFFVLARLEGEAVGCGGMATREGYGELKRIFTRRAARFRGIARAVIARLETEARRRGLPLMRLETGEASPGALAAYGTLGDRRRGPFGA